MVSIMRSLPNVKSLFALCMVGSFFLNLAIAETHDVTVKKAEFRLINGVYLLSADINYHIGSRALDALQNGIPLFWDLDVIVKEQRDFLWDKTVIEKVFRYRIQYHALLNMYRVRYENSGDVFNFSTLAGAIDLLSSVRDLPIMKRDRLYPEKKYLAAVKVIFDRESLPLPLRPVAYLNPQWYLSSEWYVWPLTN